MIPVNREVLDMIMSMGFTEKQGKAALNISNGSPDQAVEWLFSHSEDLESALEFAELQSSAESAPPSNEGKDYLL